MLKTGRQISSGTSPVFTQQCGNGLNSHRCRVQTNVIIKVWLLLDKMKRKVALSIGERRDTTDGPHGSEGEVQQKVHQYILHKSYTTSTSSCCKMHKTQFHSSYFNKTAPQTNKPQTNKRHQSINSPIALKQSSTHLGQQPQPFLHIRLFSRQL